MATHKPSKPRGEIAELTASLQSLCTAGKNQAKKDVFRRVINYLTVGMDMSSLFPSMTSCANLSPDDLVLKKMLYLYIAHYATQTPDLALLAINQLLKDCVDQDPLVRGLALRSLCSLRLPNFLEYVTSPVLQGLSDRHPYVRRTAVMGVLKIYHVDKAVEHTGMLDTVRQLLQSDTDPQVVGNCLTVLLQAVGPEPLLDKGVLYHLINRLKELSEWSQVQVLELAGQYQPRGGEAEVYDLLNALEDRLAAPNSAVALAATKAFLHLTLDMPATHQQVLERIKEPLKSVIGRDEPAITHSVLANVLLLAQRAPVIFEADYTTFYCRAHDPWYIKKLKMEILSALASSSNVYDVVNELTEYARDVVHPNMAREAVRAVGRIALAVPDVAGIVERLLIFLESGCEAVVSEALVVMKDLLRRFPEMAEVVVAQVMSAVTQGHAGTHALAAMSGLSEPQARAALLWIMGQFGQFIPEAPYLLEQLVDGFSGEEQEVKTAFLTAATQLFFKRPPECQALLGAVLVAGLADSNQDVHDRALLYYRLLRVNIAEAERIINPPLQAVMCFSEALTPEMKDTIFKEFNTLSVIYQVPAATFLEHPDAYTAMPLEPLQTQGTLGSEALPVDNSTNLLAADDLDGAGPGGSLLGGGALPLGTGSSQPGHTGGGSELDLLDMDLLGGGGPGAEAASSARPGIQLDPVPLTGSSTRTAPTPPGIADALELLGAPHVPTAGNGLTSLMAPPAQPLYAAAAPAAASPQGLGLDLDDMFQLGAGTVPAAPAAAQASLELDPQARLQPRAFQEKWKSLPTFMEHSKPLSSATISAMAANQHKDLCAHLTQAYIQTIASGGQPPVYKYYFYGLGKSNQAGLVELLVYTQEHKATMTYKSELGGLTNQFIELFENCLAGFER